MAAQPGSFAYAGYNAKKKPVMEEFTFDDEFSKTRLSSKALKNFVIEKLQPRQKDYNGIGVAKPSVFVEIDGDDFREVFEEVCSHAAACSPSLMTC